MTQKPTQTVTEISAVMYLGHSAVIIEAGDARIAIDPWLDGNPSCPTHLQSPDRLDLIILTHGHSDHAGDALRLAKKLRSSIAAIYELAMLIGGQGVPENKLIPMNKGGTVSFGGLSVTLTHALHSSSYTLPSGQAYAGEACGVIVGDGKRSIYHSGDTCLFSDMKLIAEMHRPDVAFLPIGDHFTMGPKEAAKAAAFISPQVVIPMHYKTFGLLTGTADEFQRECEQQNVQVVQLNPGARFDLQDLPNGRAEQQPKQGAPRLDQQSRASRL